MAELSRYRASARERIKSILDSLPKGSGLIEANKAMRGQGWPGTSGDGLCWARQCWSREVRDAIRKRFGDVVDTAKPDAYLYVAWNETNDSKRWLVNVSCRFCNTRQGYHASKGGCIACFPLRERLEIFIKRSQWQQFRKSLCDDPTIAPIVADWMDDVDMPELAEILRTHPKGK